MTEEKKYQDDELRSTHNTAQHSHVNNDTNAADPASRVTFSSSSSPAPPAAANEEKEGAAIDPFEQMVEKNQEEAEAAKVRGNAHYAKKQYEEAISAYTDAILLCPESCSLLLSTFLNNRAAAHLQLHHNVDAIADCSASIAFHPSTKALLRRSTAYEREDKLTEAIADLKAVIEKGDGGREEELRLRRLEATKRDRDEKMKDEMLGKLKELGNGLLGKIGMSLDDFKAIKDDKTGSYSISFNKR